MRYVIGLLISIVIVAGVGYGLNQTVIKTHQLEQQNE